MERTLISQLAFRYLRGKRSANAVPILSRISMVAIAVSAAAMIIVFSVFNGLEGVVKDLYKAFYPDIRITAAKGKFFTPDPARIKAARQLPGVEHLSLVIEDNVLANNTFGEQKVVSLKGIDKEYLAVNDLSDFISRGEDSVSMGHPYTAIAGSRILNDLGADVTNIFSNIEIFYLNPSVTNPEADPTSAFQSLQLHPAGEFTVGDEFDGKYVLAPLPLVQNLFKEPGRYSSIEIKTQPGASASTIKQLHGLFGNTFKVESRYEQNKTMYMVMNAEKWAVYAILVLVLFIASFNMVGALSMLVLEKQKDIAILRAMGALSPTIRKIFLTEGMLWSFVGGVAGIALGCIVCLIQQHFGIVKLGNSFVVDAYPVEIQVRDIALVFLTIVSVGLLAAWYPAVRATSVEDPSLRAS